MRGLLCLRCAPSRARVGGRYSPWDGRPPPPDAQATPLCLLLTWVKNILVLKFRGRQRAPSLNHRSRCSLRSIRRAAARCAQSASPVGSCVCDHDRRLTASRACSIATTRFRNVRLGRIEHGSSARSLSSTNPLGFGLRRPGHPGKVAIPAQHDSPSPLMTASSLYLTSEPWPPFSFGRPIFRPSTRRERMSSGHLCPTPLLFALHRRSSLVLEP